MSYLIQIIYFNSDSGEMTLLSEYNILDHEDLKKRVINPYPAFEHSFYFLGNDLFLASQSFNVYASERHFHNVNEYGRKT